MPLTHSFMRCTSHPEEQIDDGHRSEAIRNTVHGNDNRGGRSCGVDPPTSGHPGPNATQSHLRERRRTTRTWTEAQRATSVTWPTCTPRLAHAAEWTPPPMPSRTTFSNVAVLQECMNTRSAVVWRAQKMHEPPDGGRLR